MEKASSKTNINEYYPSNAFLRFKNARAKAKQMRLQHSRVKKSEKIVSLSYIVEKYICQKIIINLWIKSMKWNSEMSLEKTLLMIRSF